MLLVYSLSVSFIVTVLLPNGFETLKKSLGVGRLEVSTPVVAPDAFVSLLNAFLLARHLDSDQHDRVANFAISSKLWQLAHTFCVSINC